MRKFVFYFGLLLLIIWSVSALGQVAVLPKVENVKFESKLVGAAMPYNVILPPGYADPAEKNNRYQQVQEVLRIATRIFNHAPDTATTPATAKPTQ